MIWKLFPNIYSRSRRREKTRALWTEKTFNAGGKEDLLDGRWKYEGKLNVEPLADNRWMQRRMSLLSGAGVSLRLDSHGWADLVLMLGFHTWAGLVIRLS